MIEIIGKPRNSECNKTNLSIDRALERKIIHRDYLGHMLRWTHAMKHMRDGYNILDVGCADAPLAQVLYTNRFNKCNYTGVDIRTTELEKADKRKLKNKPRLIQMDITKDKMPVEDEWANIVTCFEVAEHIPESSLDFVLSELQRCVKPDGKVLLSTPNYDGKNQASNHVIEYTEKQLRKYLEKYFVVEKQFGTFASQKDIKPVLTDEEKKLWDKLREYYDVNMFSVLFAPIYPLASRNILWVLEKKRTKKTKVIANDTKVKNDKNMWEM